MLNRTAIRKALASYKEAKRQQAAILKDKQIQGLFAQEKEDAARALILEKYPNGIQQVVSRARIKIINEMIKNVPSFKGITAEDVLCAEISVFDKMIELAEQV